MLLELVSSSEESQEATGYFFPVHDAPSSSPQFYFFFRCLPPGPMPEAIHVLWFVANAIRPRLCGSSRFVGGAALTFRQLQILGAIFRGVHNGEVAAALGVSTATVKRDVGEIFSVFGVASRKQLLSSRRALEVLEQNLGHLERLGASL